MFLIDRTEKYRRENVMAQKPTIHDVARAANVSIATVSRVLNNPQTVRNITRQNVQQAISDTGYETVKILSDEKKMQKEQSENKDRNKMILAILPELKNPFYVDILSGIQSAADYRGYDVVLYRIKEARYSLKQLKRLVDDLNVRGVLFLRKVTRTEELEALNEYVPVVQCAEFDEKCKLPYVSIDDYAAAKTAMRLLLQTGHKRIALGNGPLSFKYAAERERGYRDALQEAGIPVEEGLINHQPDIEFELAMSNMTRLIKNEDHPDAVFAVSDVIAIAAVKAARHAGLKVPEDLAVIGFDGTYISNLCDPPLTVIRQRGIQLGTYACDMLLDLIHGIPVSNPQILVEVELLIRGST